METKKANTRKWYRLDNAAKIFPAVSNDHDANVYRVGVRLYEDVDPHFLSVALHETIERYPSFKVKLRRGVFWYLLEYNENEPILHVDDDTPCAVINTSENNEYLFKLSYYKRKISLDVFHSLSDATGAFEFLKTLLYSYFKNMGKPVEDGSLIKTPQSVPLLGESEDSFSKYFDKNNSKAYPVPNAYKTKGTYMSYGCTVIYYWLSTAQIKKIAKEHNATVTELLATVLALALYNKDFRGKGSNDKPINILIPVNLRNFFPSVSVRNFVSTFVVPCYIKDEMSFDDVLAFVKEKFSECLTKEKMARLMGQNVKIEKNMFIRIAPRVLKDVIMRIVYRSSGPQKLTTNYSNVGVVKMPACFENYVDAFEFQSSISEGGTVFATSVSYGDKFQFSLLRTIIESEYEMEIGKLLKELGLDPVIEGTYYEEN